MKIKAIRNELKKTFCECKQKENITCNSRLERFSKLKNLKRKLIYLCFGKLFLVIKKKYNKDSHYCLQRNYYYFEVLLLSFSKILL